MNCACQISTQAENCRQDTPHPRPNHNPSIKESPNYKEDPKSSRQSSKELTTCILPLSQAPTPAPSTPGKPDSFPARQLSVIPTPPSRGARASAHPRSIGPSVNAPWGPQQTAKLPSGLAPRQNEAKAQGWTRNHPSSSGAASRVNPGTPTVDGQLPRQRSGQLLAALLVGPHCILSSVQKVRGQSLRCHSRQMWRAN